MIEIKVPELAESISEGTIAKWLVNEGDQVNKGDNIVELETDKVNLEVSAEDTGVLKEIKAQPGDDVEVDEVIGTLDENAEAGAEETSSDSGAQSEEKEDKSKQKQESSEPEAKKEEQQAAKSRPEKEPEKESSSEDKDAADNRPVATPAARKLAREQGIDLSKVQTQDPMGRVRAEDVKSATQKPTSSSQPSKSQQTGGEQKAESAESDRPVERQRMSRRRQTIANRLVGVQQNAAMLTTFNEVDMTNIMEVRKRRKEAFLEQHGVKLGFMSFFTKAAIGALKAFPLLNAEIQENEILVKKYYDIGIAVSTEQGLVVPVVRNADRLGFAEIEQEVGSLSKKARDNQLGLKEIQGGSFTITNGGVFGSLLSTPILNAPQVGILGMHKIQTRPVAIDANRMENRPMMYLAVSYDHRIVDGSEAVSFLVRMKELLEDPETLLLEG